MTNLVKFGRSQVAWQCMEIMFPEDDEEEKLKKNLEEIVLKKDKENLNLIDYCFLKRKTAIAEHFKALIESVHTGGDYKFPVLMKIHSMAKNKTKKFLENENKFVEEKEELVLRYGGGLSKKERKRLGKIVDHKIGDDLKPFKLDKISLEKMKKFTEKMKDQYAYEENFFRVLELEDYLTEIVDTKQALETCLEELEHEKLICFDVEFCMLETQNVKNEEKIENFETIKKVPSSIQIASDKKAYWLDAIKLHEHIVWDGDNEKKINKKFFEFMQSDDKIRVYHSCESDVNVIYQALGIIPGNIFDSARCFKEIFRIIDKISAKQKKKDKFKKTMLDEFKENLKLKLNFGKNKKIRHLENAGLGDLAQILLDIRLDKSLQKATWNVRPLPKIMLDYALTDAVILYGIAYALFEIVGVVALSEDREGDFWDIVRNALDEDEFVQMKIWARSNQVKKWISNLEYNIEYKLED